MANLMHQRRSRKNRYVIRVTSVNHAETKEHTGMPSDNIWRKDQVDYGVVVRGLRADYTNNPSVIAVIPSTPGGEVDYPNVGDYVVVEDNGDGFLPYVSGAVNSLSQLSDADTPQEQQEERNTWDNAVRSFARPISPSLELPGSRGRVYTYNPIYMTYHSKYTDSEATNPDFGAWYDRFVLFPSSETYKNKKPFVTYNEEWINSGLDSEDTELQTALLYMTESWQSPKRLESSFYLKEDRYAYRTDPVFDTTSPDHQSSVSDPVTRNDEGGVDLFSKVSSSEWDKYPMPLGLQPTFQADDTVERTAYDEIINETLGKIRRNAHNAANADLPLEPKEEKQFRMGRNKIIMSDMHGDGKRIMLTLKTAADQQVSLFFHDDDDNAISQVRVRGMHGDSFLMETVGTDKSSAKGRITFKGIAGQLFEMYDDAASQENYIYMLTSDSSELESDYSLGKSSYVLIANNGVPGDASRVGNSQAAKGGRVVSMGIHDSDVDYEAKHDLVFAGSLVTMSNTMKAGASTFSDVKSINTESYEVNHNIDRIYNGGASKVTESIVARGGVATLDRELDVSGMGLNESYNGVAESWSITNKINGAKIDMLGDTINVDAPTAVNLGGASRLVARQGDPVVVAGITGVIGTPTQIKVRS